MDALRTLQSLGRVFGMMLLSPVNKNHFVMRRKPTSPNNDAVSTSSGCIFWFEQFNRVVVDLILAVTLLCVNQSCPFPLEDCPPGLS